MKMLIAGGGTGGHLYPGIALAEELTTRQKGNEVLFVGTERGLEARVVPKLFPIQFIEVGGLKRMGLRKTIGNLLRIPKSLLQSVRIIRTFKPDVAVGVGGYASGPVILMAWLLGVPTAILEQNTVPGFTNRILSRFVRAIFITFDSSTNFFPAKKCFALGNPIRRSLLDNFLSSKLPDPRFNILVLGGSQGAHALNLRMVEAASILKQLGEGVRIVHQTGATDEELVRKGYTEAGVSAEVKPFIEDMSDAYRRADIVVCRAGATTLAEVTVAKKAAILVPYPYAADNHQELNARAMVDAGAAIMLLEKGLDGEKLAAEVKKLHDNRGLIADMERAASRVGRPEAAREIIDQCFELIAEARR